MQSETAKSGPDSGAAIATNFATPRAAWHAWHVLPAKTGFVEIETIWLKAAERRNDVEAFGGRGCGSLVSFYN